MINGVINLIGNKIREIGLIIYFVSPKLGWYIFSIGNIVIVFSVIQQMKKVEKNNQTNYISADVKVGKEFIKKVWKNRWNEKNFRKGK